MIRKTLLSALAVLSIAGAAAPRPAGAPAVDAATLGRRVDAWAKPLVAGGQLSGNLLVARRGQVLLERSWGMANVELGVPNTPDTRFCIASINKPMTVILALQLIEENKLGYHDSLARWIPDFPNGDRITIEHLLRHRSGIPHRVTTDADESKPKTAADVVEFAKRAKLLFAPGDSSSYSSAGFSVLARVLELASGKNYDDLIRERLFEPLGMTHSAHANSSVILPGRATSYEPTLGGVRNAPLEDLSYLVGAGAVTSTARDLHQLLWADVSGKLGEAARQSALRGSRVSWNGSTNGFRAFADYDTVTGYSVIWTGNLHCGAVDLLHTAVWQLLAGETPEPAALPNLRVASVAPDVLRRYEGLYDVAGNPRLEVRAIENGLDVNAWTLAATSDSTFFSLRDYGTVSVVRGADGKVSGFNWTVAGRSFPCPRVGDLPAK